MTRGAYMVFSIILGSVASKLVAVVVIERNIVSIILQFFQVIVIYLIRKALQSRAIRVKEEPAPPDKNPPLVQTANKVADYLARNATTEYFKTNLEKLESLIRSFHRKLLSFNQILDERFEAGERAQYTVKIEMIENHLLDIALNTVNKLEAFDEVEYDNEITELSAAGKEIEADDYRRIETEYKNDIDQTVASYRRANLKLDELIMEKTKFLDIDSAVILDTLDEMTTETKMQNR